MQKYYEHGAPVEAQVSGARLNLTFRWIKQHTRGCGCCARGVAEAVAPAACEVEVEEPVLQRPVVVQHWAGKSVPGADASQRAVGVADAAALVYAAALTRLRSGAGASVTT